MSESITRTFAIADLEVRTQSGDGRTIRLLAVPFDHPTEIYEPAHGQFIETMKRGAFERTIRERGPQRVKLLGNHDRQAMPLGKAVSLVEEKRGLVGEFKVSKTARGDEALELARDGSLDGASVGMRVIGDQWNPARTERDITEARLDEISLTAFPAYATAGVLDVRALSGRVDLLIAQEQRLDLLRRRDPMAFDF